jgi:ABC-2 type transport system ATP-binding protein
MVDIRGMHFRYRKKAVFDGLDLELKSGHIYGLLGKNGMGKSTLLRCICGLLFPQRGKIEALGFSPRHRQPAFLNQVFMIPEEFYLPDIRPARWVETLSPFYPSFDSAQFDHFSRELEIEPRISFGAMSYGQRKKTLIAFGLASRVPLLLMDEPTNGLDILSKSQFRKVMAGCLDEKKCILISTHQVRDLDHLIDRILIIDEGKILFNQAIDTICQKLSFSHAFDSEELSHALYAESSLKGSAIIRLNKHNEETRLDLEMLYKALLLEPEKINSIFQL